MQGPQISSAMLKGHKRIALEPGDNITLKAVGEEYMTFEGWKDDNGATVGLSLPSLECKVGDEVLLSDGQIVVQISSVVSETEAHGTCKTSKKLGERKTCNIPFAKHDMAPLLNELKEDLDLFVRKNSAEYVSAFVQCAEDVLFIKNALSQDSGSEPGNVLARIENAEALKNFDEILHAADGVILCRGNLGREICAEKVALAQRWCVTKARIVGKLVFVSDEILESMITNPRPTRAEMTDAANAILDGADGLILCRETGIGMFPADAVSTISAISRNAELGVRHTLRSLYSALQCPNSDCCSCPRSDPDDMISCPNCLKCNLTSSKFAG